MNRIVTTVLFGLAFATLAFAADTAERQSDKAKADASQKTAAPKSEQGEKVKTPFGYVKKRNVEKPADAPRPAKPNVEVKVAGDKVTFKRKTPFGVQAWTRARSELSDDERKLAEQAGVDVSDDASASKPTPETAKETEPGRP